MVKKTTLGFELEEIIVPLDRLVSHKRVTDKVRKSQKYKQTAATIKHVDIIEPIVVFPMTNQEGYYRVLSGHVRLDILLGSGTKETSCLLSKDDEAFTYNNKVQRPTPIQEHFMVLKAVKKGLPEDEIAKVLNVNVAQIRAKRNMLRGICDEAIARMKDYAFTAAAIHVIRKMHAIRQIVVVNQMIAMNSFSEKFARQMLLITPENLMVEQKPKYMEHLSAKAIAQMDTDMAQSRAQQEDIREKLGTVNVQLTRMSTYCEKLLRNGLINQYLKKHHAQELDDMLQLLGMYRTAKQKKAVPQESGEIVQPMLEGC